MVSSKKHESMTFDYKSALRYLVLARAEEDDGEHTPDNGEYSEGSHEERQEVEAGLEDPGEVESLGINIRHKTGSDYMGQVEKEAGSSKENLDTTLAVRASRGRLGKHRAHYGPVPLAGQDKTGLHEVVKSPRNQYITNICFNRFDRSWV